MFDYYCPSGRMGLRTGAVLESAALLRSVHVGAFLQPGKVACVLGHVLGSRVENRVVRDIPPVRIHQHPQVLIAARIRRRLARSGKDTAPLDLMITRMHASIARKCVSPAVIGVQGCSLELFEGRTFRAMEQFSPPIRYERAIASEELARFPGWAHQSVGRVSPQDCRMEAEWQKADLIWVPSQHLIDIAEDFGADPRKFRVIPYPITHSPATEKRVRRGRQTLRVVFAGTLMLEKGVQYIYQALCKRPGLPVDMHFFGPRLLTQTGMQRLAEVGTIHGPVARSQLLEEFRRADILLFPSLSEGSALVTLEAAGLGLPVVATRAAGAPASSMIIPPRSPEAITEAIEELSSDPDRLATLSAAALTESANRNFSSYTDSMLNTLQDMQIAT